MRDIELEKKTDEDSQRMEADASWKNIFQV